MNTVWCLLDTRMNGLCVSDENGKDQGVNVRQKVKEMMELVQDDDRLREERKKAKKNRDKYIGVSSDSMSGFRYCKSLTFSLSYLRTHTRAHTHTHTILTVIFIKVCKVFFFYITQKHIYRKEYI